MFTLTQLRKFSKPFTFNQFRNEPGCYKPGFTGNDCYGNGFTMMRGDCSEHLTKINGETGLTPVPADMQALMDREWTEPEIYPVLVQSYPSGLTTLTLSDATVVNMRYVLMGAKGHKDLHYHAGEYHNKRTLVITDGARAQTIIMPMQIDAKDTPDWEISSPETPWGISGIELHDPNPITWAADEAEAEPEPATPSTVTETPSHRLKIETERKPRTPQVYWHNGKPETEEERQDRVAREQAERDATPAEPVTVPAGDFGLPAITLPAGETHTERIQRETAVMMQGHKREEERKARYAARKANEQAAAEEARERERIIASMAAAEAWNRQVEEERQAAGVTEADETLPALPDPRPEPTPAMQDERADDDPTEQEIAAKAAELAALNMTGVTVELVGTWLWAGGNTRQYKDDLKGAAMRWSPRHTKWYWKPSDSPRFRSSKKSYQHICATYGVQAIQDDAA